jgi:hypothetical protein
MLARALGATEKNRSISPVGKFISFFSALPVCPASLPAGKSV